MENAVNNLNFEQAIIYRNRIQALTSMQSEQNLITANIKNADVIIIDRLDKEYSIFIQFIRNSQNYGTYHHFIKLNSEYIENNEDINESTNKKANDKFIEEIEKSDNSEGGFQDKSEIIKQFIMQFYQNFPPTDEIIINYPIEAQEVFSKALALLAKHNVTISNPQKGDKYHLLKRVEENAHIILKQRIVNQSKQQKLFKKIESLFTLPAGFLNRIEIYDNSHIQGKYAIGAMVVMNLEGFAKKYYRRFNFKLIEAR